MMKMNKLRPFWLVFFLLILCFQFQENRGDVNYEGSSFGTVGQLIKKDERKPLLSTEFGAISAVNIGDGIKQNYHLQFITLEPNSLFLPVLLHADLVLYVHTGSGRLSWTDSDRDKIRRVNLQQGDVFRIRSGDLFYLHSSLESERQRLRIIALFANPDDDVLEETFVGPYSSINDLIRGFDKRVLQAAFQVPEEVIEEITSATDTPAIVHAEARRKNFWEENVSLLINAFLRIKSYNMEAAENKKHHSKTFNVFQEDPDYKNSYGWSTVVTKHNLHALHGSHVGVFMVNLTEGSMMGPHWNPRATEVSVVLKGEGMVRIVCASALTRKECKNTWFRVEEGDVFTVPRLHPMAQTSFNNSSLVFMGFSTTSKKNHPQFLAGKASVLQTLDKLVLAASFNVSNTTIDQLLAAQDKSIILECTHCAEEQEVLMEQEIEQERREEEKRRREEEEQRRREEEEQRRREEEEQKRHEEEEERKREEEEAKRRQEEEERRKREEEERQQEEEEQRRREQEEERKREEEETKRREEEEKRRQEEEARRREEQEKRRREEEAEEEERRRREAQEEEERKREKEEMRRREEEEKRRREEEAEEEQRRQEEEEQRRRQAQEEEERKREEEEMRRRREEESEEEQQRQEEEDRKRRQAQEEEKARRREEEQRRQEEEEEQRRREAEEEWQQEEEKRRRQQEQQRQEEARQREEMRRRREERRRQAEEERRKKEEERRGHKEEESEEEAARREEEERVERERQQEEAAQKRREIKLVRMKAFNKKNNF